MANNVACPYCNSLMIDDGRFAGTMVACTNCTAQFQMPVRQAQSYSAPSPPLPPPAPTSDAADPFGANPYSSPATTYSMPMPGYGSPVSPIIHRPHKEPGIAAVLSFFFAGLGQIYNGEIGKGLCFILANVVSFLMCFFLIGFPMLLIVWIFGIYDAYTVADQINRGTGNYRRYR